MRLSNIFNAINYYKKNPENIINFNILNLWKKVDIFGDGSCKLLMPLNGNMTDLSGNYNPQLLEGKEQYISGEFNRESFLFDESTSIGIPIYSNGITYPLSLSFYFNAYKNYTGLSVFSNLEENEYLNSFALDDNNNLIFYYYDGSPTSVIITTIELNKWYFITLTIDEDKRTINIYLDGNLIKNIVSENDLVSMTDLNYLKIGKSHTAYNPLTGALFCNGAIQQIRYFNRSLTSSEVNYLYKNEC